MRAAFLPQSSIRRSALDVGSRFAGAVSPALRPLRIIAITYALVVILLGISLYWNIRQAADSSARGQALYKIGLRDGELFTRAQILRAQAEEELIPQARDRQAKLNREKL